MFAVTQDMEQSCKDAVLIYKQLKENTKKETKIQMPQREMASALQELLEANNYYYGTYKQLFELLKEIKPFRDIKTPKVLSMSLKANRAGLKYHNDIIVTPSKKRKKDGYYVSIHKGGEHGRARGYLRMNVDKQDIPYALVEAKKIHMKIKKDLEE